MNEPIVEQLRKANQHYAEYIDWLVEQGKERQRRAQIIVLVTSSCAALVGWGLAMATAPMPQTKNDCSVYKVDSKAVTSFVLKPPPAPAPIEPPACPVAPKCEAVKVEEPAPAVEEPQPEPRRRKHHRVRRYWR